MSMRDLARSKSGELLSEARIREEIARIGWQESTIDDLRLLLNAKAKVERFLRAEYPEEQAIAFTAALDGLAPPIGKPKKGLYDLFYGAIHDGFLYVDETILNCPLQMELTLLHEACAAANNSHEENLDLERDYIRHSVTAEGKYELDRFPRTITEFLQEKSRRHGIDYLGMLRRLMLSQPIGKIAHEACDDLVNRIIDAVNCFERVIPYKRIKTARISTLENFEKLREFSAIAENMILKGGIAFEGFYAGAGERMGRGPFYSIDAWTVVEEYLRTPEQKLGNFRIPSCAMQGLGLGPRQLLELRIFLEQLAAKNHIDVFKAIANFVIILHVNAHSEKAIKEDLVRRKHYGFEPKNVLIVPQPVLPGWHFDKQDQFVLDPRSKLFPYNHGWARMQLNWKGQAYWLERDGQEHRFEEAVVDRLLERDIRYLTLNRINDLTRLSPRGILDVEMIALSLHLMQEEHYSMTVELVGNDTGEKGGLGLAEENSEQMFLVEGLCSKSRCLADQMNEVTKGFKNSRQSIAVEVENTASMGPPYNAMRQIEDIQATKAALKEGLPVVLRYREGRIYLEVPTGDMTNMPGIRARAVMHLHDRFNPENSNGELIYDFKKPEHAYKAAPFLQAQDQQQRFRQMIKE